MYVCLCVCGKERTVRAACLAKGESVGCYCKRPDVHARFRARRDQGIYAALHDYDEPRIAACDIIFKNYVRMAAKRQIPFTLTGFEFAKLVIAPCVYCGKTWSNTRKAGPQGKSPFLYNGIDRLDGSVGYCANNCAPCCSTCNFVKRELSQEEFLALIARIYTHSIASVGADNYLGIAIPKIHARSAKRNQDILQ